MFCGLKTLPRNALSTKKYKRYLGSYPWITIFLTYRLPPWRAILRWGIFTISFPNMSDMLKANCPRGQYLGPRSAKSLLQQISWSPGTYFSFFFSRAGLYWIAHLSLPWSISTSLCYISLFLGCWNIDDSLVGQLTTLHGVAQVSFYYNQCSCLTEILGGSQLRGVGGESRE